MNNDEQKRQIQTDNQIDNASELTMWLLLLSLVTISVQQQWEPSQYPNPRKGGFKQCNMRSVSNVCDPDEVLNEGDRYRLNNELQRISARTGSGGSSYCDRKGVDAVLAIVKQGSQQFANDLSKLWHMDDQCKRSTIFLLSGDDRKLYFASQANTGFNNADIQSVISSNEELLQRG
ncbi:hypothetical protein KIN20_036073 [Parelaphostrongylus tenuis]|nr:hypothetical protein KIN20_036073 [Parelaphostrongylus tenuis]